jgi:predicted transcriptional regulator of viral defense system
VDPQDRTAEHVLARIAAKAHGVVARSELIRAGLSSQEIKHRVRTGALIPVHRGVYRVGHRAPSHHARYMAAVLACGDGALLSGRAAGHLQRLLKHPPSVPEVTTPTERHVKDVTTHRQRKIHPADKTIWQGIPATTVPRTLVDLAATLSPEELARACHEAGVLYDTTP